jgi:hypothetical protein
MRVLARDRIEGSGLTRNETENAGNLPDRGIVDDEFVQIRTRRRDFIREER